MLNPKSPTIVRGFSILAVPTWLDKGKAESLEKQPTQRGVEGLQNPIKRGSILRI